MNYYPIEIESTPLKFIEEWCEYRLPLTNKLLHLSGDINLDLKSQSWVKPQWWDREMLQLQEPLIYQREIYMQSKGLSYWYARSVIPYSCFHLDARFFERLENESMRYLIFDEPRVQRINLQTYPIDSNCIEFYWPGKSHFEIDAILWVRLSTFSFEGKGFFYLIELLFPQLQAML